MPSVHHAAVTIVTQSGIADWLTAIGTVGATLAAVVIALYTDHSTRKRVSEERQAANRRLHVELNQSRQQFQDAEKSITEKDQYAEAYCVQVVLTEDNAWTQSAMTPNDDDRTKTLVILVANHGRYAIINVQAQFTTDGKSTLPPRKTELITGWDELPEQLRAGTARPNNNHPYGPILAPTDTGLRFESDEIGVNHITQPDAIVTWTDRWGTMWEHRRGTVEPRRAIATWLANRPVAGTSPPPPAPPPPPPR
jgi:hypothetical protein